MDYRLKNAYDSVFSGCSSQPSTLKQYKSLTEAYNSLYSIVEESTDYVTFDEEEEYIEEAVFGKNKNADRYVPRINAMLQTNEPLDYTVKGVTSTFTPHKNQIIQNLTDVIKGVDENGIEVSVSVSTLEKSAKPNKGEVAEGLLGVALFARLNSHKDVSPNDVFTVINSLPNNLSGDTINVTRTCTDNKISDKFELIIRLKNRSMKGLLDTNWLVKSMTKIINQICNFVNAQGQKYSNHFHTNKKADHIVIKSDGVSGEGNLKNPDAVDISKTDVEVYRRNEDGSLRPLTHMNLSVKTGTTKQIGQHGGGKVTATLEQRFETIVPFWKRFGVNILKFKQDFASASNITEAYKYLYKQVTIELQGILDNLSKDAEKTFLKTLIAALNFYGAANQKNLKLVQFTDKSFYALDFNKTNRLLESDHGINFSAEYDIGKKSGLPEISINNLNDPSKDKLFLKIRMYMDNTGYVRNYVEKGPGLVKLLKVKGSH